jgi:flavin-binding protein dodecin
MNMIRLIQILIGLVLFFSFTLTGHSFSQGKIVFKEVLVTGIGQSQEEAVNNALAEAISSVNGKNVQTQTIIKIMGGEEIPDKFYQRQKENKDRDAQRQKENKDRDAQTARYEIVGKTLENLARIIKGQPEKANETKDKKTSSGESPQKANETKDKETSSDESPQ